VNGEHLSLCEQELIYTAIDSAAIHLYAPGLKNNMRNAIWHGARAEQIRELYELTAWLGAQMVLL